MSILTSTIFALAFLLPALPQAKTTEGLEKKLIADFKKVVAGCGERIWPNYQWTGLNVVFVTQRENSLTAFSGRDFQAFRVAKRELPDTLSSEEGSYVFFEKDGASWMALGIDPQRNADPKADRALNIFQVGIHEAFHHLIQNPDGGWMSDEIESGPRGTEVPVQWRPRFYRRKINDHLLAAFLSPAGQLEHLGKARYWFDLWSREYPAEVRSSMDRDEGTARYAEFLATALLKKGCTAGGEELAGDIRRQARRLFTSATSGQEFALDAEGYDLGGLSGFLLDWHLRAPNWKAAMAAGGQTPLSAVLAGTAAQPDRDDPKLAQVFKNTQSRLQKEIDRLLAGTYGKMNSAESYFVAIPRIWYEGSTAPAGMYIDPAKGWTFVPEELPFRMTSPDRKQSVQSAPKAVFLEPLEGTAIPCSADSWIFIVEGRDVRRRGNRVDLRGREFQGTVTAPTRSEGGHNWLCVE